MLKIEIDRATEEEVPISVTALALEVITDPDFVVTPAKAGGQGE